jgi:NADH-quinone oxidoreductase subunit C
MHMDNATVVAALKTRFGDAVLYDTEFRAQLIIWIAPDRIVDVCTFLRDEPRFRYNYLSDVAALDRLGMELETIPSGVALNQALRFVVNYQLLSIPHKHRVWLKVALPSDNPIAPSVTAVWPTANFHEREVFDLFGINFSGHPDLRRILMPDDYQGHPLRKDHPLGYEEVQFSHNFDRIQRQKHYAKR